LKCFGTDFELIFWTDPCGIEVLEIQPSSSMNEISEFKRIRNSAMYSD